MGQLNLPSSGAVYLDSNCLIYSVEKIEPYCSVIEPVWLASKTGDIRIICSQLALLETLVKPVREGDAVLERMFRELLLASNEIHLQPITDAVLERAITLRAKTGFKTPDAIHAATAIEAGCAMLITGDSAFKRIEGLQVVIL